MTRRPGAGTLALLLLATGACSPPPLEAESLSPLPPDRHEYAAFRAQHSGLPEPNYLPFLVHRLRMPGSEEDLLVTCRWPDERFPLRVAIEPPELGSFFAEEARPTPPAVYVEAVKKALARWEREMGPPVRFRAVPEGEPADITVRLFGEEAPLPAEGKLVLGMTPLQDACVVKGGDPATGRIDAALRPPEVSIFVSDEYGLLTPEQVETVAAHEIGHALGARSHSPFSSDLMYEVARDRLGQRRLSETDTNSFAALYAVPSGTVYARRKPGEALAARGAPPEPGPKRLAERPWEDARNGFSVRLPEGWTVVPIDHGVAAVDGFAWDYDASLQLISVPVAGIDEYLERYGAAHFSKGPLLGRRDLELAGRPALRFAVGVEENDTVEEVTLIEAGEGRVLLVIGEAPAASYEEWRPWLQVPLGSLVLSQPEPEAPVSP